MDFNNLAFRSFFAKEVSAHTSNPDFALWRFIVFDCIYNLLCKINNTNEVVIAVDDKKSWRKSYFQRYKESRKKNRDKTDIYWDVLYSTMDSLAKDLRHHFPFKVIKVSAAEADDIIAVLCQELRKKCVIYSNDEDYFQLQSDRISIYNPKEKKIVKCGDPNEFLIKKCLMGQKKDDIFNVITPTNWGKTEGTKDKRKPGFGEKAAKKVLTEGYESWLEKSSEYKKFDTIVNPKENFHRNRILIDFDKIPDVVRRRIGLTYDRYSFPPPTNMYKFFKMCEMQGYLDDYTRVENKLLTLY